MGTNFYIEARPACAACGREAERGAHVGKRSAAGLFCFDCKEALIEGGARAAHSGAPALEACPKCHKKFVPLPAGEGLSAPGNPGGVELGFARPRGRGERPAGVAGCSSFTWAMPRAELAHLVGIGTNIVDEYGHALEGAAFLEMLEAQCPIEFHEMVGRAFS